VVEVVVVLTRMAGPFSWLPRWLQSLGCFGVGSHTQSCGDERSKGESRSSGVERSLLECSVQRCCHSLVYRFVGVVFQGGWLCITRPQSHRSLVVSWYFFADRAPGVGWDWVRERTWPFNCRRVLGGVEFPRAKWVSHVLGLP